MAEAVMQKLVSDAGLDDSFLIDSAGTASYHTGESLDMRMQQFARQYGYRLAHRARRVCSDDFAAFDMLIGMDDQNVADLEELAPDPESKKKIYRMADFADSYELDYVPDPYYGGADGFRLVIEMLEDGCAGLLNRLTRKVSGLGNIQEHKL